MITISEYVTPAQVEKKSGEYVFRKTRFFLKVSFIYGLLTLGSKNVYYNVE